VANANLCSCHVLGLVRCQFQELVYRYQVEDILPGNINASRVAAVPGSDADKEIRGHPEHAIHPSGAVAGSTGDIPVYNPKDTSSNALNRDMEKCVLCSRCIRACSGVQGMVTAVRLLVETLQMHCWLNPPSISDLWLCCAVLYCVCFRTSSA